MSNEQRLEKMLDSLRFGQQIFGIDSMLTNEMKGLEISRAVGKIYVGHGYGTYGIRKKILYFPDAKAVLEYLRSKMVNLDMLKVDYDPSFFNGL